jgi:hypothetical protein
MDAATPPVQVIQIDDQEKQHLEKLAHNITMATDQKTGIPEIQSPIEQSPLTEETQKEAEEFHQEQDKDQPSKLSAVIPALQKSVRYTKASNFLGKKMEWLGKKSGGEVILKEQN